MALTESIAIVRPGQETDSRQDARPRGHRLMSLPRQADCINGHVFWRSHKQKDTVRHEGLMLASPWSLNPAVLAPKRWKGSFKGHDRASRHVKRRSDWLTNRRPLHAGMALRPQADACPFRAKRLACNAVCRPAKSTAGRLRPGSCCRLPPVPEEESPMFRAMCVYCRAPAGSLLALLVLLASASGLKTS